MAMPGWIKVVLIVLACVGGLVIAAIGAGVWWWSKHGGELVAAGSVATADGQAFGATTDNAGCVARAAGRAAERAKSDSSGMMGSVSVGMFTRGCLAKSRATAGFCDGVPARTDFAKLAAWMQRTCETLAVERGYCGTVAGQMQEFCHPRERNAGQV